MCWKKLPEQAEEVLKDMLDLKSAVGWSKTTGFTPESVPTGALFCYASHSLRHYVAKRKLDAEIVKECLSNWPKGNEKCCEDCQCRAVATSNLLDEAIGETEDENAIEQTPTPPSPDEAPPSPHVPDEAQLSPHAPDTQFYDPDAQFDAPDAQLNATSYQDTVELEFDLSCPLGFCCVTERQPGVRRGCKVISGKHYGFSFQTQNLRL